MKKNTEYHYKNTTLILTVSSLRKKEYRKTLQKVHLIAPELVRVCQQFFFNKKKYLGPNTPSEKDIIQMFIPVEICGNHKIKSLNNKWRNKNKATDVLSWQNFSFIRSKKKQRKTISYPPIFELGNLMISIDKASMQSKQFSLEPWEEVIHLLIHGFLHLCDFDHERSIPEQSLMEEFEEQLIKKIRI